MPESRQPEQCPYRQVVTCNDQKQVITCDFILQRLNDPSLPAYEVSAEICTACCLTFEPTPRDINVPVASILFNKIETLLEDTLLTSERRDYLTQLSEQCEASLPVIGVDEHDLPQTRNVSNVVHDVTGISQLLPLPEQKHGSCLTWAVGLTTAPRRLSTLEASLDSFLSCGWEDVHLFIDGDVALPGKYQDLPNTIRSSALGAWPNYYLSLQELYHRNPHADVYMMLQDDLTWPNAWPIKQYLEQLLWPGNTSCLVSLYCGSEEATSQSGWSQSAHWTWGALAFLFPHVLLEKFLTDPSVFKHIQRTDGSATVGIDIQIGEWAAEHDIPIYRPDPSLVQHTGEISSIWEYSRAVGVRAAERFIVHEG